MARALFNSTSRVCASKLTTPAWCAEYGALRHCGSVAALGTSGPSQSQLWALCPSTRGGTARQDFAVGTKTCVDATGPSARAALVSERVAHFGMREPTPMSLKDLCAIGHDLRRRREHGEFLHRELRIRLAHRVLELQSLPCHFSERRGVKEVIRWYTGAIRDLENCPRPRTAAQDESFTQLLRTLFQDYIADIESIALEVQDLQAELGSRYGAIQSELDAGLRKYLTGRIGLRFLWQHYIASCNNQPGYSGIIELDCNPAEIARKTAKESVKLCRAHLGESPQIVVEEESPGVTTCAPMHLQYILMEVFKNACRAVVERHGGEGISLPSVSCQIVHGSEGVTLKISDKGGGIAHNRLGDVWKLMYSTYKKSPRCAGGCGSGGRLRRLSPGKGSALAGYGVGLALSRLYAQHFGGDLKLASVDGLGTDVYVELSQRADRCENLPEAVLHKPPMRDVVALGISAGGDTSSQQTTLRK